MPCHPRAPPQPPPALWGSTPGHAFPAHVPRGAGDCRNCLLRSAFCPLVVLVSQWKPSSAGRAVHLRLALRESAALLGALAQEPCKTTGPALSMPIFVLLQLCWGQHGAGKGSA